MEEKQGLPVIAFPGPAAWEEWLEANNGTADGVWLKLAKKGSGVTTVTYAEAVEVALCHGWIDGQVAALDASFYLQRFTPRRARSPWSQINRGKVEQLVAAGRMRPAGLAAIEAAKADGRWDRAYAPPSQIEVPPELQAALDAEPAAAEAFAGLSKSMRYSILWRVHEAKRPETKARRIEKYVGQLARGEQIQP
jgi:uncharacterized protein YdeI (YjbR/CyaY-like superfamily)